MNHTCVTFDDKGAFGRQETETTTHIVAGLRARVVAALTEHMRKISIKSNINSEARPAEEALIPANRKVSGWPPDPHTTSVCTHTTPHFITRRQICLPWVRAVPVDAVSLRGGEPSADAQRHTHQTHQIHLFSSPQERCRYLRRVVIQIKSLLSKLRKHAWATCRYGFQLTLWKLQSSPSNRDRSRCCRLLTHRRYLSVLPGDAPPPLGAANQ